ncbi:MAG: TadE family type IV pilus minor pilin, partial [Specibacter sp.]
LRLEEGARAGARALARGESTEQARQATVRLAGDRASVAVNLDGGYATVTVAGQAEGPFSGLMPWRQTAQATARVEDYEPASGAARSPGMVGKDVVLPVFRFADGDHGACGGLCSVCVDSSAAGRGGIEPGHALAAAMQGGSNRGNT